MHVVELWTVALPGRTPNRSRIGRRFGWIRIGKSMCQMVRQHVVLLASPTRPLFWRP